MANLEFSHPPYITTMSAKFGIDPDEANDSKAKLGRIGDNDFHWNDDSNR